MTKNAVGVGLLGCGVVGQGVAQLLLRNAERYAQKLGVSLALRAVGVRDRDRDRGIDPALLTTDLEAVVDHADVQVVVEVLGGVEPALSLILRAIRSGKCVVTANKEVLAKHGGLIFGAAKKAGVEVYCEGAVGGGIPILMPLKRSLAANELHSLCGIINGTTNYILSQMSACGLDFEGALAEAQRLGYAEAEPAADVGGFDAANKLAILAAILMDNRVELSQVYCEGIERISPQDLAYARELGYAVKLLGIAKRVGDVLEARVHPTMIPLNHPLARIEGVTNAITVVGDAVGEVTFSGPGAGRMPTASAVVGDLLNAVEALRCGPSRLMSYDADEPRFPVSILDIDSAYYLRVIAADVPGALGAIGTLFGAHGVSIRSFVQKAVVEGSAELVFVTHRVRERALRAALEEARALPALREVKNLIRVEDPDA